MAEERDIIINVEVDDNSLEQQIGDVNKQLRQNRQEIKELSKDYEANSKEIAALELSNKELAASKRDLVKQNNVEKGSLNALRLELANQTKERNSLNLTTVEGRKRADELNASIAGLNETIKAEEQAGGDFRRNVGNYPKLFSQAAGSINIFGTSLSDVFKIIVANPIGLLVTALAGLVKVFSETQAGAEFFRKTSAALNTGLGVLKDVVEALGVALIDAFENPQETLKNLVQTIQDGIVNYFTRVIPNAINTVIDGFGLLGKAAKQVFEGDFSGALETATEASGKLLDGVTDLNPATFLVKEAFEAAIPVVKEYAESINEVTNAAFGLENQLIANEKAIADQQVLVAQSIQSQKELNLLIEDQTASFEDRITAAQQFAQVEQEQINESIRLQEERIAILKAQNELTNSTEEDIQRVRDAEIELANLQAASFERQVTNQNKLNSILNQQRAEELRLETEAAKEKERLDNEVLKAKQKNDQQALSSLTTIFAQGESARKAFALSEIGVDTAKAISALTAASEGNPANAFTFGGAGIAQFTTGLLRIGANISSAKSILGQSSSGFGGGGGGNTAIQPPSVSVADNSGLANVNASLLSQFSQPALQSADQAERAAAAVQNLPPIQVAVTDINTAQSNQQVKVTETTLG